VLPYIKCCMKGSGKVRTKFNLCNICNLVTALSVSFTQKRCTIAMTMMQTRLHSMSQVKFTNTVSDAGVVKIYTLLGSTYAIAQKLTCGCNAQPKYWALLFPRSNNRHESLIRILLFSNSYSAPRVNCSAKNGAVPHWVYHNRRTCTRNFQEIDRRRSPTLFVSSFHGRNTTGLIRVGLCQEH